jgi:hypothetical protein
MLSDGITCVRARISPKLPGIYNQSGGEVEHISGDSTQDKKIWTFGGIIGKKSPI